MRETINFVLINQHKGSSVLWRSKARKSPGSDGFPVEYYTNLVDELSPILTQVYSEIFKNNMLQF